ncbi:MAG: DUF2177 family protein [Cytophagales bacterium]
MKNRDQIILFLFSLTAFLVIDLLWLGIIARDFYFEFLGDLLAVKTNWSAAFVFYFIYIIGILHFSVIPSIKEENRVMAFKNGAFLGFLCYSTFELTALALLRNWPEGLVWIDILWGTVLTSVVAGMSYIFYMKLLK